MDVAFTDEQELLRSSAREFLAAQCTPSTVREVVESGADAASARRLWEKMAKLGWMGLGIDESLGGHGLGLLDVAILSEEMGRALAPVPWFSSVALFGEAVHTTGTREQRAQWLPRIAGGELTGTVALLEPDGILGPDALSSTATATDDGYVLCGTKAFVPDLMAAGAVVVTARLEGQPALFVVDRDGVETIEEPTLDPTRRLGTLRLDSITVGADRLLGGEPCGWDAIEKIADRASAVLCAEMCGGAQKALDMAVEYARVRQQFGRPIGSFQGVSHRCADMLLSIEGARSLTYYAAWCCDQDLASAPVAVSSAKAWAGDTYRSATAQSIQIHGGIGFTWEADIHLWYRRAYWTAAFLGDSVYHRERVAKLIGL